MRHLIQHEYSPIAKALIADLLRWKSAFQFFFDGSMALKHEAQDLMTPKAKLMWQTVANSSPLKNFDIWADSKKEDRHARETNKLKSALLNMD
jgi:hypothetical protein